ncbi:MAG: hypothetical protein AB3N33_07530, partial [Puniceicoccaceae bacterium]
MGRLGRFSLLILTAACCQAAVGVNDPISEWNGEFLDAVRRDPTAPCLVARNLAIFHIALHDGLESLHDGSDFIVGHYAVDEPVPDEAYIHAAASKLLAVFYPSYRGIFMRMAESRMESFTSAERESAIRLALEVAARTLEARKNDGAANTLTYVPKDALGKWRRTPPGYRPPELSHWSSLEPFVLPSPAAFRPPPPPALDSEAYARAVE